MMGEGARIKRRPGRPIGQEWRRDSDSARRRREIERANRELDTIGI
jgi:hypothetical protein